MLVNSIECIEKLASEENLVPPAHRKDFEFVLALPDTERNRYIQESFVYMMLHPAATYLLEILSPYFRLNAVGMQMLAQKCAELNTRNLQTNPLELIGYCMKIRTYHRLVLDECESDGRVK